MHSYYELYECSIERSSLSIGKPATAIQMPRDIEVLKMWKFSALPGVFAGFAMLFAPALSSAGISFSIGIAPPVLQI